MHPLLRQALILDIETTGLERGAGVHELATYDLNTRALREYIMEPNLVVVDSTVPNDQLKMVSGPLDQHQKVEGLRTWLEALQKQGTAQSGKTFNKDVWKSIELSNPFLHSQLKKGLAPHLLGNPETLESLKVRQAQLRARGVSTMQLGVRSSMDKILGGELKRRIEGHTVWIANAAFESKQFGAQLAARPGTDLKSGLETFNVNSPDPFYVTGKDVNASRVQAQLSGDWSGVWKAYKRSVPKAGETAVRDILDVTKAFMSFGKKLGLTTADPTFGTSIDVSKRLLQLAEGIKPAGELHRAAEDVVDEAYVLKRMTGLTESLEQVHDRTGSYEKLISEGRKGRGPMAQAANYFANLERLGQGLQEEQLVKRLARAQRDIGTEGQSVQYSGIRKIFTQEQQSPAGDIGVKRTVARREHLGSMEEVTDFLVKRGGYDQYGASVQGVRAQMSQALGSAPSSQAVTAWESQRVQALQQAREGLYDTLGSKDMGRLQDSLTRHGGERWKSVAKGIAQSVGGRGRAMIGALGVLAATGAVFGTTQERPSGPDSILSYGYDEWLQHQAPPEGLASQGMAKARRPTATDFGSPYRGPEVSQAVMADQELLKERERWMRAQYGAKHFDPVHGLFGLNGVFKFGAPGYSYMTAGTPLAPGTYSGVRGKNLMVLNMQEGGWKMTAEDADTVVVKRGGVRGAVASFFGFNKGYSFRLAGIDSTETSHGSTSYHAPQPGADNSTRAMQMLLAGSKSTSIVFDPGQTTYGRMMGVVIADGKNVNFEAVKRGWAAHLPFGNPMKSMIDYRTLKAGEERAYSAGRGMWATPWARTYYEASEAAGERVTFNTLAKKTKLVQNAGTMSMLSLMEENQRNGSFSERQAVFAREIGSANNLIGPDKVGPIMYQQPNAPHNTFMQQQKRDLAGFMRTSGRGHSQNKFSRRSGYGRLDGNMALDTMGTTNSVWTKRKLQAFESYGSQQALRDERRSRMAAQQRAVNSTMFQSSIGHHRM